MGAFKGTHAHGRALLMYRKMKKGRRDLNKIRPSVDNTKRSRPTARSRTNTHVLLSPTYLGILIAVDGDGGVNLGSEECSQLAQEQDEHAKPDRKKGAESTTREIKNTRGRGSPRAEPVFSRTGSQCDRNLGVCPVVKWRRYGRCPWCAV